MYFYNKISLFVYVTLTWNNFFTLNFFAHKANLFRNQNEIPLLLVYNMTIFGGNAQAVIFHALEGVFRVNYHAPT